uniref:SPRY domain-containing protein n=1 Tax=Globodera pallida TaxID=36090 RepID=A0A183CAD3_GLOPA
MYLCVVHCARLDARKSARHLRLLLVVATKQPNQRRFWKDGIVDGGNSKFGVDDVVGCGVNLATAKAFDCPMDLFPCVSLEEPGDSVETNFGPNFKFNLADEFKELGWGK